MKSKKAMEYLNNHILVPKYKNNTIITTQDAIRAVEIAEEEMRGRALMSNNKQTTDRGLLKEVWKDIVAAMGMYSYTDPKAMFLLATAEKIREHINNSEPIGWEKEIIVDILKNSRSQTADIIHKETNNIGIMAKGKN